jgi:hypothetical protein
MLAFLLAGFALAGSPGPNTLSLVATGAAFGTRRGLPYMVGLTIGVVAVMAITATGVMGVVLAMPGATPAVTVAAGAYFVYLAFRIATAPPLSEAGKAGREPTLVAGIAQSLVNPKAYAAMAALFSGFILVRNGLARFGGQDDRDHDHHHSRQCRMADGRRGVDTMVARPAGQPDHQCELRCPPAHIRFRLAVLLTAETRKVSISCVPAMRQVGCCNAA